MSTHPATLPSTVDRAPSAGLDAAIRDPPLDLRERLALAALERRMLGSAAELPVVAGRYELRDEIGAGGMGVVRRAYDRELRRVVAMKFLRLGRSGAAADEGRLVAEAQALARLSHPNVVAVFDVRADDDACWVAMEYIRGTDVPRWLAHMQPEPHEIVAAFVQAASGLAAAHAAGLVHRDVKPSNIMIGDDGRVRVVDFGLARSVLAPGRAAPIERVGVPTAPGDDRTPLGCVVGTPGYTAPELLAGGPASPASDQFSWCVALFEALARRRPYEPAALLGAGRGGRLPRAGAAELPIARELQRILARGLAARPEQRWPSMRALVAAIESAQPRRRWRRTAAGLLATVAGLGLALRSSATPTSPACDGGQTPWTVARRDALMAAFAATDEPYAREAADHAAARLERWALDYADARATLCRPGRAAKANHVAVAGACLDRAALEVDALVELLVEADATAVQRSAGALGSIHDPDECLRPTQPTAADRMDAATRTRLETELAQAAARTRAGRPDLAEPRLAALIVEAARDDATDLVARAHFHRGVALRDLWREDQAHTALSDAYFEALRIDDVPLAIRALVVLVLVDGDRLGRVDDAQQWARHAHALLDANALGPEIEAQLLHAEAAAAVGRGEYELAVAAAEAAISRQAEAPRPDPLNLAWSLHTLGNARHELEQFALARDAHARARELAIEVIGDAHPDIALIDSGLAGDLLRLGQVAEALATYTRVLAHREREGRDPAVAQAHNNLAVTYETMGRLDDAARHYERAVALYERSGARARPNAAATHYNLGHVDYRRGRTIDAAVHFRRALELREALFPPEHPSIAATMSALAVALEDDRRFDEAQALHLAVLQLRERVDPSRLEVGHALYNLGLHADKRGDRAAAIDWLGRARVHADAHAPVEFQTEVRGELGRILATPTR